MTFTSDRTGSGALKIAGWGYVYARSYLGSSALFGFTLEPVAGLRGLNGSAAVQRPNSPSKLLIERSNPCSPVPIVFFDQSQRFPQNFTGRIVAARFNLGTGELFKFGSERDIRGALLMVLSIYRQ